MLVISILLDYFLFHNFIVLTNATKIIVYRYLSAKIQFFPKKNMFILKNRNANENKKDAPILQNKKAGRKTAGFFIN